MLKVNKANIELLPTDTQETIVLKVANVLKTIPSFILESEFVGSREYVVNPLFYLDSANKVKMGDGVDGRELDDVLAQKLYIVSKIQTTIDDFGNQTEMGLNYALFELENELGAHTFDYQNIWNNRLSVTNEFTDMVQNISKQIKERAKTSNVWKQIVPSFKTTSFTLNKINHETVIDNRKKINELMVFDVVQTDDVVIACFYKEMIKFNPEYSEPINNYLSQSGEILKKAKTLDIVRVLLNRPRGNQRVDYPIINIFVKEKNIAFTIESFISSSNENEASQVIEKIINSLDTDAASTRKEFYYGSYSAFIHVPLLVVKELVTNDKNVSSIAYINESAIINTRKTNLNLFLKGSQIGVGLFERPDTVGTFVRIKKIFGAEDLDAKIKNSIDIVNKLLAYAATKVESVSTYYNQYVKVSLEVQELNELVEEKENTLKKLVPEIFLPNYTRLCAKPPIIVDDPGQDENILKFPIHGEAETRFYKCPYSDFVHPGLRKNLLSNKDKFPFVPCCYQQSQKNKANYKMYYNEEDFKQRINSGEIGKTLKILAPNRIGELSPNVGKLLQYTTGQKFYRFGIPQTNNSCIQLLEMVTSKDNNWQIVRKELAKRSHLCKAEMSQFTNEEIAKKLLNKHTYIDPKYFKGALEDYYNISFILFSKDNDDFSVYPNKFLRFICPLKPRVVFIMEHEKQQHVELIVDEEMSGYLNKQTQKPILYSLKSDKNIRKIFELYSERFNYVLYDTKYNKLTPSWTFREDEDAPKRREYMYPWEYHTGNGKMLRHFEPKTQYIDSFGKTRLVEFQTPIFSFVGEFPPLPCINVEIKDLDYFIKINSKLSKLQIQELGRFSWLKLYLTPFLAPTTQSDNKNRDTFETFTHQKKLAEYLFWAACHFYSSSSFNTVDEWIRLSTRVVEGYTYSAVVIRPHFNREELLINLSDEPKFIFDTLEFQNRVRYNLSLISSVNLKLYSANIYHQFYQDPKNFTLIHPTQLALNSYEYFQQTKERHVLHVLSSDNLQYIKANTLYLIKEFFGDFKNSLCLVLPSLDKVYEEVSKRITNKSKNITLQIYLYSLEAAPKVYLLGDVQTDNVFDTIVINVNKTWFYGLILHS
ncbi:dynein-like beta chain [Chloriridovirus anopheles1]|uniref:Dynein-like beta chain n=1 Tax=Chloriridovirus anopheles1 TaxID=1465751 RepID=W8QN04_9VIRU|nr:dynein-like beta chain [Anopheles minimus iridovirus]AHL67558.1 dynein-like beta chain [Anopheles minimus iridovirus]